MFGFYMQILNHLTDLTTPLINSNQHKKKIKMLKTEARIQQSTGVE